MIDTEKLRHYVSEGRMVYGVCALLITLNLGFYIFISSPGNAKILEMKQAYMSLKGEKERLESSDISSRLARDYLRAVENDIGEVMKRLPDQGSMTDIIQRIHSLAKKEGLAITSASYSSGGEKGGDIVSNVISFPLSGDYRKLRRFIYGLENLEYLISIDDLNISASRGSDVSLSIRISVYFRAGKA